MSNRIPRQFNQITGKMLIETNLDKIGDILHIVKDDYGGYRAFNLRTEKYGHMFPSMLRTSEVIEIVEII